MCSIQHSLICRCYRSVPRSVKVGLARQVKHMPSGTSAVEDTSADHMQDMSTTLPRACTWQSIGIGIYR